MNEHDELVILREKHRVAREGLLHYKRQYDRLFDYWNEKHPDEMSECMEILSKVELLFPDVKINKYGQPVGIEEQ